MKSDLLRASARALLLSVSITVLIGSGLARADDLVDAGVNAVIAPDVPKEALSTDTTKAIDSLKDLKKTYDDAVAAQQTAQKKIDDAQAAVDAANKKADEARTSASVTNYQAQADVVAQKLDVIDGLKAIANTGSSADFKKALDKAVADQKTADYWANRAAQAVNDTAKLPPSDPKRQEALAGNANAIKLQAAAQYKVQLLADAAEDPKGPVKGIQTQIQKAQNDYADAKTTLDNLNKQKTAPIAAAQTALANAKAALAGAQNDLTKAKSTADTTKTAIIVTGANAAQAIATDKQKFDDKQKAAAQAAAQAKAAAPTAGTPAPTAALSAGTPALTGTLTAGTPALSASPAGAAPTAALPSATAGALTGNAAAPVISNDGGSIISQDSAGIISQDSAGFVPSGPRAYKASTPAAGDASASKTAAPAGAPQVPNDKAAQDAVDKAQAAVSAAQAALNSDTQAASNKKYQDQANIVATKLDVIDGLKKIGNSSDFKKTLDKAVADQKTADYWANKAAQAVKDTAKLPPSDPKRQEALAGNANAIKLQAAAQYKVQLLADAAEDPKGPVKGMQAQVAKAQNDYNDEKLKLDNLNKQKNAPFDALHAAQAKLDAAKADLQNAKSTAALSGSVPGNTSGAPTIAGVPLDPNKLASGVAGALQQGVAAVSSDPVGALNKALAADPAGALTKALAMLTSGAAGLTKSSDAFKQDSVISPNSNISTATPAEQLNDAAKNTLTQKDPKTGKTEYQTLLGYKKDIEAAVKAGKTPDPVEVQKAGALVDKVAKHLDPNALSTINTAIGVKAASATPAVTNAPAGAAPPTPGVVPAPGAASKSTGVASAAPAAPAGGVAAAPAAPAGSSPVPPSLAGVPPQAIETLAKNGDAALALLAKSLGTKSPLYLTTVQQVGDAKKYLASGAATAAPTPAPQPHPVIDAKATTKTPAPAPQPNPVIDAKATTKTPAPAPQPNPVIDAKATTKTPAPAPQPHPVIDAKATTKTPTPAPQPHPVIDAKATRDMGIRERGVVHPAATPPAHQVVHPVTAAVVHPAATPPAHPPAAPKHMVCVMVMGKQSCSMQ